MFYRKSPLNQSAIPHLATDNGTQSFSQLELIPELKSNLDTLGFTAMTTIQAQSLPIILKGQDLIGQGKTGSGKTAAFGLGLLNKLNVKRFRIQSVVMCPTRELADQVAKDIRNLARGIHNIKVLTLCGGVPIGPQIGSLEHGAHIIVGTPGRILDHLERERLDFTDLTTLVLDEADRMLEMGFQQAITSIIAHMPKQRQTLLFSATFPKQIEAVASDIMHNPQRVKVESTHTDSSINQHFYAITDKSERIIALRLLLLTYQPRSAVIFCNTKRECQQVSQQLTDFGFDAKELHGDLDQKDRDRTLIQFTNKSVNIIVATDVAARGLDIDALDAVFNYELAYDTEVHIHRIGRTGRAGAKGEAFTFYGTNDGYKIALLEEALAININAEALPSQTALNNTPYQSQMVTLLIDGGKKQKLRPGDILGALTADKSLTGKDIGKITLTDIRSFVAVEKKIAHKALNLLNKGKLKGRQFRAWQL